MAAATTDASRVAARRTTALPESLQPPTEPGEGRCHHRDVQARDRHQVARATARELLPLVAAQRVLESYGKPGNDARRRSLAERVPNDRGDVCACEQHRVPAGSVSIAPEAFAGTHVTARADVIPQHPRLVVAPTRVGKPARTTQLHLKFECLGGIDPGGRVVPGQLDEPGQRA